MVKIMSWILAPIALCGLLTHMWTHSYTRVIDRVSTSVVRITGQTPPSLIIFDTAPPNGSFERPIAFTQFGGYVCSGFVITIQQMSFVQTAAHCVGGQDLRVNGHSATVVKVDKALDLALLASDVASQYPPLVFRDADVVRFETTAAIGYAWGWTRLSVLNVIPMLIHYSPYVGAPVGLLVQHGYIGGMSGGPVIDRSGRVVGIVQQSNGAVGYGVETALIKAFLLGVQ